MIHVHVDPTHRFVLNVCACRGPDGTVRPRVKRMPGAHPSNRRPLLLFGRYDLTPLIGPTAWAGMMRQFWFVALRTEGKSRTLESVVGSALVPSASRMAFLW
jgi:hypothetical protein